MNDFFAHVFVISLARSPERLAAFWKRFPGDWPFVQPVPWAAVDGAIQTLSVGWRANAGAYGLLMTNLHILESVLTDERPILILEDDCAFERTTEISAYLESLPEKWELAYLGCEHHSIPRSFGPGIVRATAPHRTHAVAIAPRFFRELLDMYKRCDTHIDHMLECHGKSHQFYAANPVFAYQAANFSDINQRQEPTRTWDLHVPLSSSFSHSGKFGDIIYALPAMRHLGGGKLFLNSWKETGMLMNPQLVETIASLLRVQPYIDSCEFSEHDHEINLNKWRWIKTGKGNLADKCLTALGLPTYARDFAWLEVPKPLHIAEVVMSRSHRYHNPSFPWQRIVDKYASKAVFIGSPREHEAFCYEFGEVAYRSNRNFLEMASVIEGSKLFIGNQSSPLAVAQGLHANLIQEVHTPSPDCIFSREGELNGWDESLLLPEV